MDPTDAPVALLDGVTHRYEAVEALSDVTLGLARGQVTALLGPNGAGKTTVVRLLTGLAHPTRGRARLFGGDPQRLASRRRLGVMLQVSKVPETLTVREHVHLFSSYYPSPFPLGDVLRLAGLEEVADRRYGRLSGGQQQRVLFALAICGNPSLLVPGRADRGHGRGVAAPVLGVDPGLAEAGRSILLTTHYLEEADALANRVVVVNRGRVVADGTPAAIKRQVAGRQVRCHTSLPHRELAALPGVHRVAAEPGGGVLLVTADSDRTVRALLASDDGACQLDVRSAGLEEAFLALTTADQPAVGAA